MRGYNQDDSLGPAIGIDLGTWKCCVAVLRDGKVEIIENERGSKTTPSYVAFTETERIIGEDAKSQMALNPANTVYGVKRIIGRRFDDPSLQDIKKTFPFTVKKDNGGKTFIEVSYKGNKEPLYPEQVTAMLLTKMKRIAVSHLQCKVKDAVISVPAHFNNAQRQATKDAGVIAGLNVLGLINEPTAAALAYRDNKGPTDETICLADLGGGTLDVSIIRMEGNRGITVLKTCGNTSFGGIDLDQQLVIHFEKEFLETSNHYISGNKASERLRLVCEKLKHTLSLLPTGRIQLDCLAMNTDLESSISRDLFVGLCHDDLERSLISVLTEILLWSKQECEQFNRVVLVGGSTRIPYVQELLINVMGKGLDKSVNPDEAVAHGAAIKAALLGKEPSVPDVAVREVSARAFVMESEHCQKIVFHQNSFETEKSFNILTIEEFNAQYCLFESLFDFESKDKLSRQLIASVNLSDWYEPLESELLFSIDGSGVFDGEMVIGAHRYALPTDHHSLKSEEHLTEMCKQEKKFCVDEEKEKRRLVSLSELEAHCFRNKPLIQVLSVHDSKSEELKQKFIKLCDDTIEWLDCTPKATEEDCKREMEKLVELQGRLLPPPPPPPPEDVARPRGSVAPCTESTIDPNAGLSTVDHKTIGAGSETKTRRGVGDHPLRDTSSARPTDERVHLSRKKRSGYQGDEQTENLFAPSEHVFDSTYPASGILNYDVGGRNRDATTDSFNAANNARAGTSATKKRPLGDEQSEDPFAPWELADSTHPAHVIVNSDCGKQNSGAAWDGSNAANNARAGTHTDARAGTHTDARAGTHTDARAGTHTDAGAGTHTDARAGTHTDARAGTHTANKRPVAGFATGRHTAARAESRQLREAVPVHSDKKGLLRRGNHPFPPDTTQLDRHPGHALRNDRVGTSSGADAQIQVNRCSSSSSFESFTYLNDAEGRISAKSSFFRCFQVKMPKIFSGSQKKEAHRKSKKEDKRN